MPTPLTLASLMLGAALLLTPYPAWAQSDDATTVDDIIVVARRIDAPIWRLSQGDNHLILVGVIDGLPRSYAWEPDAIEAAVRQSDLVLFPVETRISPADIGRLLWRARSVVRLPDGTTTADYLSIDNQTRLQALREPGASDTLNLRYIADDLLRSVGYERRGRPVSDVVQRAARVARIEARPVGILPGDEMVERMIDHDPRAQAPCLDAAIEAAEAGPAEADRRAENWRRRRIPELLASLLQKASEACSKLALLGFASQQTAYWEVAINEALGRPGTTLAIAPLPLVARHNGVLDRLSIAGVTIEGPDWRPAEE